MASLIHTSLPRFLPMLWRKIFSPDERQVDLVRSTMLSILQQHASQNIRRAEERVRFAGDLESLWYLRQDLVLALAELEGDKAAREHVKPVNALFAGSLPAALEPRVHRRYGRR
jgi:hypothetical protein